MFGLVPFINNKSLAQDNNFNSLFDIFNEPFFSNFDKNFAPLKGLDSFKVDVKDTGSAYELTAELPGVKKEDINLDYENGYLTIKAVMNQQVDNQNDETAHKYVCRERYYGSVQRSFYVDEIDKANSSAEYKDGILKITLPKLTKEVVNTQINID